MKRTGTISAAYLVASGWLTSSPGDDEEAADRQYPEPVFSVGDAFVFDNPYVRWQVVAVKDGRVHWNSDSDDLQIIDLNPLLPCWHGTVRFMARGAD